MPKIIENLEARLLEEARRQIAEVGYSAMTIRSVAKACGVGVGTVYNYFPGKDTLLATFLLADWKERLESIQALSRTSEDPEPVVRCMYDQLCGFAGQHQSVFQDEAAAAGFAASFTRYHALLRSQLAAPLGKFCTQDFQAEFIAEALLTWTMAKKDPDTIWGMIRRLF